MSEKYKENAKYKKAEQLRKLAVIEKLKACNKDARRRAHNKMVREECFLLGYKLGWQDCEAQ